MGMDCMNCQSVIREEKLEKKIKISHFAERIISYYLFHREIQSVFENENQELNNYSLDLFGNEIKIEKLYILDNDWIIYWTNYAEYNTIKEELDKEYFFNDRENIKLLQIKCQNIINSKNIQEFEHSFNNNNKAYTNFISKNILNLKDFDNIVDEKTYKLLKKLSYENYFNKQNYIEGIIWNQMIILFIEDFQLIKFLYKGILENKDVLIQLSANCLELNRENNNFDMEKSKLKYEAFKKFLSKSNDEQLINLFNSYNVNLKEEIFINLGEFVIKIRNENFGSKNIIQLEDSNKINFQNINKIRIIGLDNVGATCYMNATLQCFLNINSLTNYLLNENIFYNIIKDPSIFTLSSAFCILLQKVWLDDSITSHYAPRQFKRVISAKNPLFEGINANDSKDLVNFLLEEMNQELSRLNISNEINHFKNFQMINQNNMQEILKNFINEFSLKNNSIIAHTFFFILQTNTICKGCNFNNIKYNFQALFLLEFPLELIYNYNVSQNIPSFNNEGKKCIDLYSCFNHYRLPTEFVGDNQLYCNNCHGLKDAISVNLLFSLPPVLIIILNRGKGKSFDCNVNFPQFLNLAEYVEYQQSICNYHLKGVISHLGESGMSGHFIAYCRNRVDNQWYLYNDSIVTKCKDQNNEFMIGTAYILFYESINNENNIIFDGEINMNLIKNNLNMNLSNLNMNMNQNFMNFLPNNYIINDFGNFNNMNNGNINMLNNDILNNAQNNIASNNEINMVNNNLNINNMMINNNGISNNMLMNMNE